MIPAFAVDLGRRDYRDTYDLQLAALESRKQDQCPDTLLLVEHEHVITVGRRKDATNNILQTEGVAVEYIERGGDVTYHGPGQLVAYPIFQLREDEQDLHLFLRHLEESVIRTMAEFGIEGHREPGYTGVWHHGKKVASIGIACRRWVTFHGVAININADIAKFHLLNPCGLDANVMANVSDFTESPVSLEDFKLRLTGHFETVFGRNFSYPTQLQMAQLWPQHFSQS